MTLPNIFRIDVGYDNMTEKINVLFNKLNINKIFHRLSQPDIFFYCGLYLLVLLFCGTIAQKYIGLYQAQSKYFSSFFFWFYFIPLPAGWTVMGIIFTSLSCKTFFYTKNIRKHIGSFVTHCGIILLLLGGFLTALFSKEAYMLIPEGEQSHILSDYHEVELAVTNQKTKETVTFSQKVLQQEKTLSKQKLPFSFETIDFMKNTELIKRDKAKGEPFKGFAKIFKIKRKKTDKESESNISGLTFQISKDGKKYIYSIFEGMPIKQHINWNDERYKTELRPIQRYLPFSIHLIDFEKTYYPGTNQVRSYKSSVILKTDHSDQKRVIKMNQPLRHKGYTFYQSSFVENKDSESTILAVVHNAGRAFPYFSSLIVCLGLLLHILLKLSIFRKD